MNKNLLFILITFISITFILASSAEAKRFGGGASFGGKKSYSSPFKQKSTQQKSFSQQKASAANQQRKQQLASRGGLMGMLGGLALGGLLGALFFGGAFENFNFFDFLVIGGIIWAVMWFLKRKALTPQAQASAAGGFNTDMDTTTNNPSQPGQNQFKLSSDKQDATFSENSSADSDNNANKKEASFADSFGMNYGQSNDNKQSTQNTASSNETILPNWFHQEEFLSGARSAYTMLQQAWDKGDLESIKELTTDNVYSEISRQFTQEAAQGETRILQLNAELIDFNELDDHSEASVLFDALLDEEAATTQGRANQVRELWHFVQGNNSTEPTWYLDGIQQLE